MCCQKSPCCSGFDRLEVYLSHLCDLADCVSQVWGMPFPLEYETGDTDNPWIEARCTSLFLLSQIHPTADIRGCSFVVHVSSWNWMTFNCHKQRVFQFWMSKNSLKFGVAPIPLQLRCCPNRSCRCVHREPCFYESIAICLPSWALRIRGWN